MNYLDVFLFAIGFFGFLLSGIINLIFFATDNEKFCKIFTRYLMPVFVACFISGMIIAPIYNKKYYRYRHDPVIEDVNNGRASIDSIGVINGITQYDLHWKGDQVGKR